MKWRLSLAFASMILVSTVAPADQIPIGYLSFDEFIAAGSGVGINAFNLYNLTGPDWGQAFSPSAFASDGLTFDDASLTVNFQGGSSQVISLGNIDPGILSDSSGNPVVQFPSTDNFTSAVFTATLNQSSFTLSDGSTFVADESISADLLPSSGSSLQAGVDFVTIEAQSATAMPEYDRETTLTLLLWLALIGTVGIVRRDRNSNRVTSI